MDGFCSEHKHEQANYQILDAVGDECVDGEVKYVELSGK